MDEESRVKVEHHEHKQTASPSNTFSTGGGGSTFENHVGTDFLIRMLTQTPLAGSVVSSVKFQAKSLGYQTDDILLTISKNDGEAARILIQSKHGISFSQSNNAFDETIKRAWQDFGNTALFAPETDQIWIATDQIITKHRDYTDVFNLARLCTSSQSFSTKISELSKNKQSVLTTIRSILTDNNPNEEQLWNFFRCLNAYSYDFDATGSKDKNNAIALLKLASDNTETSEIKSIYAQLFEFTAQANANGLEINSQILPDQLSEIIQPIGLVSGRKPESIKIIEECTSFILEHIKTNIGEQELPRQEVYETLSHAVNENSFIVVSGDAGTGKSAIVKSYIVKHQNTRSALVALRTQELNHPSLRASLTALGIESPWEDIEAYYSPYQEKVLLLESIERLMELNHHEAFVELVERIQQGGWKLICTCRSYQLQRISTILVEKGLEASIVQIPLLTDKELTSVLEANPHLLSLSGIKQILPILHNPFYLDKAIKIDWSQENLTALTDYTFKKKLWEAIIENSAHQQQGMHLKRGRCYRTIALARTKNMRPAVSYDGSEDEALTQLLNDNLIVEVESQKYAPAHDVFEDWAIEFFTEDSYQEYQTDVTQFFGTLGKSYIIRRGFSTWCSSKLGNISSDIQFKHFISNAVAQQGLSDFWQDAVIANVMQSEQSQQLVNEIREQLLDNKQLLKKFIHILRVACKQPNLNILQTEQLKPAQQSYLGTIFTTPLGSGWASIIKLISRNIGKFTITDSPYIANLLSDWYAQIHINLPLPSEAIDVVNVADHLLQAIWNSSEKVWFSDETPEKLIKIILQLPDAAPETVKKIVQLAIEDREEKRHLCRETLSMVSDDILVNARLCIHLPDTVIEAFKEAHYLSLPHGVRGYSMDIDEFFGIKPFGEERYFPSSPMQGPFLNLLTHHPDKAIVFITDLVNRCTEAYIASSLDEGDKEEITLNIKNQTVKQWCSWRLWSAYRGMQPVSYILESALRALEHWMLTEIEQGREINRYAESLLERSNSVSITSVLASIATAYPDKVGDWFIPILEMKVFYEHDFNRAHQERVRLDDIRSSMGIPSRGGMEDLHYEMLKQNSAKEHKKLSLEDLVLKLQFTEYKDRVQKIIDDFHAQLPKQKKQTDADKTWRIALHRMDLREKDLQKEEGDTERILIMPKKMNDDIETLANKGTESLIEMNRVNNFSLYARYKYEGKESQTEYEGLAQAFDEADKLKKLYFSSNAKESWQKFLLYTAYGHWVAYCVRDKLKELDSDQLNWCLQFAKVSILENCDDIGLIRFADRGYEHPAYFIARELPLLLDLENEEIKKNATTLLTIAVTHADEVVRNYAVGGIRSYLWDRSESLAQNYTYSLLHLKSLYAAYYRLHPHFEERDKHLDTLKKDIVSLRNQIGDSALVYNIETCTADRYELESREVIRALAILAKHSGVESYHLLFSYFLKELIELCSSNAASRRRGDEYKPDLSFTNELSGFLAEHYLSSKSYTQELVEILLIGLNQEASEFIGNILEGFITYEDQHQTGENFDELWLLLSEKLFSFDGISKNYHNYDVIKKMLFVTVPWKKDAKEWPFIKRNPNFVKIACEKVAQEEHCLEAIVSLFNSIGKCLLPEGYLWLESALRTCNKEHIRETRYNNIAYTLEDLIRSSVYSSAHWHIISSTPSIKKSLEFIADILVENGSSAAYRLREVIVTPTLVN